MDGGYGNMEYYCDAARDGVPREEVIALVAPAILPFNLIKAGINSVLTFALYKTVGRLFGLKEVKSVKECPVEK